MARLLRGDTGADGVCRAFARSYGSTLDTGRQQFYLHLDPLTWP